MVAVQRQPTARTAIDPFAERQLLAMATPATVRSLPTDPECLDRGTSCGRLRAAARPRTRTGNTRRHQNWSQLWLAPHEDHEANDAGYQGWNHYGLLLISVPYHGLLWLRPGVGYWSPYV
jgi:hypothetical protein